MIMTEKTVLYKQTKTGAIQQWAIWGEGSEIVYEHGQLDGKKQTGRYPALPKNVGKSNETTAEEQVGLEIASLVKKRLDKGYYKTVGEINNQKLLPMLAHPYEKYRHKIKFPCFVQPKLDGVRCLYSNGKLLSRGGKEYNIPHIKNAIESASIDQDLVLDGEIYIYGDSLQTINSLVKRNRPESLELSFWIYDAFNKNNPNEPFSERLKRILKLQIPNCVITRTTLCDNEQEIFEQHAKFVGASYEGSIVRDASAPYAVGQRSNYLLKIKDFKEDDFIIIGCKEGIGKFEGCAIFQCQTKENKTFDVTSPGTIEEKKIAWKTWQSFVDKTLKVKYFDLTEDKIPRFPVAIATRLEQDV
jgi:DNA ligase-1